MPLRTDPLDVALENGDLAMDDVGALRFVSGTAAVVQLVEIALRRLYGEWFANTTIGVPWFDILGKKFDDVRLHNEIRKAILSVDLVSSLDSLSVSFDRTTRAVTADWRATATFGDTVAATTTENAL